MSLEQKIREKAKTPLDIEKYVQEWRETFRSGTLGNHRDYAKARDTRHFIEQERWVPEKHVLAVLEGKAIVDKQKLLEKLLQLTKPRAGSIYSIQQEEGMMLLLTELLVGVKPRSRDHVEGLLHNLHYGFTAKGPRSKTIKKLMELKETKVAELTAISTKKETQRK